MKELHLTLGDLGVCPLGLFVEQSAEMEPKKSAEGIVLSSGIRREGRPELVKPEKVIVEAKGYGVAVSDE